MSEWLPRAGIAYSWSPDLGGRRRLAAAEAEAEPVPGGTGETWRHPAFRAYAAYARTPEFVRAADALAGMASGREARAVAFMCAETLWWKCHRRILADYLVAARGLRVGRLSRDGRVEEHLPPPWAGTSEDGRLAYGAGRALGVGAGGSRQDLEGSEKRPGGRA
jgi:uncharacterized protein (DUF488 family)